MVQNTPLKLLAEIRPSRGYATCDGPSYLRRSVLHFCHEVQRVDPVPRFQSRSVLERRPLDGPSCLWRFVLPVVEGNEESSRRNYTSMGRRSPSRSVVTITVRRVIRRPSQFLSQMILLLEMTKQVVTIDTNLPIVRPRTITTRKTRARMITWICKKMWISFLHISLILPSGLFNWPTFLLNLDRYNLLWSQLAYLSI